MMRIYAVADIHGKKDKIEKIKTIVFEESPDLVILAGDITQYVSPLEALGQLAEFDIPVFAVRGNSDLKGIETLIKHQGKISLLSQNPLEYQGKNFLGLNGTLPLPFVSKICLNETKCFRQIEPRMTPDTILVVHPPPRGILDKAGNRFSVGSFCLRHFIENHPPLMVICGHIHEQAGYRYLKNTLIVNCAANKTYTGAIIDCKKDMPLDIKMVIND